MPLKREYIITSPFGMRVHPVTHKQQLHEGIDIKCAYEDIYSYAEGEIIRTAYHKNLGYYIDIDHGYYITRCQHLSKFHVEAGQQALREQLIATSGNTGMSTGPHLHFGIKIKETGKWVDPEMFSPVTKIEIDIDGKKYKGLLDHEEDISYVEVRKPFEDLGHKVDWQDGVKIKITDYYDWAIDKLIGILNGLKK
jgi:murein DD-endopeptidase MepM/ murein hydrolase activator NlpD